MPLAPPPERTKGTRSIVAKIGGLLSPRCHVGPGSDLGDMRAKDSRENGPHALLQRMVGNWAGTSKLWLEPGKLEEETDIVGSMILVQGWAFLQHDYVGSCMEKIQSGVALFGYSCGEDRWTAAWTDSFHNGTRIMFSEGEHRGDISRIDVFGTYPAPPGPDWGWRTTVELLSEDHIVITHYNITPEREEAKAVEIDYRRV